MKSTDPLVPNESVSPPPPDVVVELLDPDVLPPPKAVVLVLLAPDVSPPPAAAPVEYPLKGSHW